MLSTIEGKATQVTKSGARWLRVDWRDSHWQLAEWWAQPLAVKALKVKQLVAMGVEAHNPFDGVIVTPGALIAASGLTDERVTLVDGTVGLRRLLPVSRVRETVLIPLTPDGRKELPLFVELFDAERAWLPWALEQLDLPRLDEIVRPEAW